MILNTTNVIRYQFYNARYALQNKQYKLYIKNSNGWHEIFSGLTFFDQRGVSNVFVDDILRDLIFRWDVEYYDDQVFRPVNFISDVQNQVITPIELNGKFMTSYIKCVIGDNEMEQVKEITGAYSLFYESTNFNLLNPYNETDRASFQNLSLYTKVLPHIPNVSTNKFWLGINFSANKNYGNQDVYLKTVRGYFPIKRTDYGNYTCAFSLEELRNNLNYANATGDTTIMMSGSTGPLARGDQQLAIVDKCPADYYVAYTTNYGWNCWGFRGNVTESLEQDNKMMTNAYGHDEISWNRTKSTFNLYTQLLTREEYRSLMGLYQAYKIYLYDVRNDKGTWVMVTNKQVENIPNKTYKAKVFNIELTENKYQIA